MQVGLSSTWPECQTLLLHHFSVTRKRKPLVRLRPSSILCCCHLLTSLILLDLLSFHSDSNYNLKRCHCLYRWKSNSFAPKFLLLLTFTWTPSRVVIPRVAVESRRQIFMHLISDTKLPLADHNPSLACDSLVFTLLNLRETPSSWFLTFFPSRQPRFGFSSIFNHPSATFCFLTGFPIICSVTEFPSESSRQLKMIGILDEWLVFVWAVSSVPCLMSSLACLAQGLTDPKWTVSKYTWYTWQKGRTHGRRW